MLAPRTAVAAMAALALAAGSASVVTAQLTTPKPRPSPPPSPTPTISVFCRDLPYFQSAVFTYQDEIARPLRKGKPPKVEKPRKHAATVARLGKEMRASVPPDIDGAFRTVLDAVDTSAGKLDERPELRDVVRVLFGKKNRHEFEAIARYRCR